MIFSKELIETTEKKFDTLLERAGEIASTKILSALHESTASEDVIFAVKWMYAHSPLTDFAEYDTSLFLACAEHGIFLKNNSPFLKDVPEDVFLSYVLHIRINEEELCDCRRFFYDLLKNRIQGLSMEEAILEINYFNAENVTYRFTDIRTISALTQYKNVYGRCGEESVFGVNVFRALGIPARQVFTPRWAHCDDNHAWVEVWQGGKWHFLGACEPEEVLDRGWFTNASGRAMLIQSRCFGDIAGEEFLSKKGMVNVYNHLPAYAKSKKLVVEVKDGNGKPVSDAQVYFGILNFCEYFPSAIIKTDEGGRACLTCGIGSLNVRVKKGDVCCETFVAPETERIEIILKPEQQEFDVWTDYIHYAPKDGIPAGQKPTEAQKELGRKKLSAANEMRTKKALATFDEKKARSVVEKYGYSEKIYTALSESYGNLDNLIAFLEEEEFSPKEKEALLLTLAVKDYQDINIQVLRETLSCAREYEGEKDEFFYKNIVCPRVEYELLKPCRRFILAYFSEEQKEDFRKDPKRIWEYLNETIGYDPALEHAPLISTPIASLTVKYANPRSRKILFVSICRSLGIAARLNPLNALAEYAIKGEFIPVEVPEEKSDCVLLLKKEHEEIWRCEGDFSVQALTDGVYQTLGLGNEKWDGDCMTLPVRSGQYRIITGNRLPNGNIHASMYHFRIKKGETKTVKLHRHQAALKDLLSRIELDDFTVLGEKGEAVKGSSITRDGAVLMWLEEGKEPTEHLLNEMLEKEAEFKAIPNIAFIVRDKKALENEKIKKVLKAIDKIKVYFDSFVPNVEAVGRRVYVDHEKLPLIVVTNSTLQSIYACSGYNVGSADMIVKINRYIR